MTSESLTTDFLSNHGYLRKYETLFGFTGTLGSKSVRDMLKEVYEIKLVNLPRTRKNQFTEFEPLIVNNQEWIKEIVNEVHCEAFLKRRGVLVICETIANASIICQNIKKYQTTSTPYN